MAKKFLTLLIVALLVIFCLPASAEEYDMNLAEGLKYTIKTGEPVTDSYANYVEGGTRFDINNGQLTDGKTAPNSASSEGWYKAFRAQSRIITFDLGQVCAISHIEAGFLHQKPAGIYAPRYINVRLSDDGESFGTVAMQDTGIDLTDTVTSRRGVSVSLSKIYSARYVEIEFSSDIFTFCDEIRIIGSKTLSGNEAKAKPDAEKSPKGYVTELNGGSDIIKLYNGYYQPNDQIGILSEEDMLPYVAYIDTDGKIAGLMFDAVAFVPCHGDYPSGGRLVKTNGKSGAVMSDWELYFDYTFKEGQDLDALDKVVARVYSELGIKGKYKVYLTLPYPTVLNDKPFGDINGDGSNEYCKTLAERVNIVKWYADKCIAQFKENNYANIELAGFYWLREEINYSDSDHEAELVKEINKYLDKKKLTCIFDPFYLSTGFDHWEELGFDAAVMQPNVAFSNTDYFNLSMLSEFAESVYNNHLGVEIETNEPSYFRGDDYLKAGFNYESYLYYGSTTGYMNALKTYYQGSNPGSFYDFCYADVKTPKGIYLRRLYDITYNFIHGVYKNEAPTISVDDIELVSGDSRVTAEMNITDEDSYWGDIKVEFTAMPEHGRVTVAGSNKMLVFRADEGYVGNDSFTLYVTDGFNKSEEITVNVTVHEKENIPQNESLSEESSSAPTGEKENTPPLWLIILLSLLGLAIVAVAVAAIVKRK